MTLLNTLIQFWHDHSAICIWLAFGLLNVVLHFKTPEQWVALGEKYPRLQNIIRVMRAVGLDPVKLVTSIIGVVTAKTATKPVPAIEAGTEVAKEVANKEEPK
jgi:hypothetical protein